MLLVAFCRYVGATYLTNISAPSLSQRSRRDGKPLGFGRATSSKLEHRWSGLAPRSKKSNSFGLGRVPDGDYHANRNDDPQASSELGG
jgi:hypothetical protein